VLKQNENVNLFIHGKKKSQRLHQRIHQRILLLHSDLDVCTFIMGNKRMVIDSRRRVRKLLTRHPFKAPIYARHGRSPPLLPPDSP
jgi:hypothetical protein